MADYELTRTTGQCSVTGRAFNEDEAFYSVVIETAEGFERRDIAEDRWDGPPEDAVCHFKTKITKKDQPRKMFVDDDVLINFFLRVADSTEPLKLRFRFVLSLILLRKRLVRYERTIREADAEYWEMKLMRDKSLHKVFNPSMNDAEIEAVTGELGAILHGDCEEEEPSE